ncbi:helix-turn-helix transcriptional regulator [Bacillus thuringiensis]|uniref:helix-turn-helix domain-containing protein n=1 Tax=Bacillus thuringiensis TaxID=1428 RepID=UPI0022248E33|nr:helix-turn-helix transcriptional regulator [Bacillus thuringiensis]UYX50411.1 helix-turn-helix transcriptional regulator [Bacillus thuringiensis]
MTQTIKLNTERARELRENHGYTHGYVAQQLNCHKSAYGHIERGFRQPSIDKLGKLSELYGVSTDELLKKSTL